MPIEFPDKGAEFDDISPAQRIKPALPRISLVDDQEDLHAFFKALGESGHFQLGGACFNGAEALKRLPAERPDAVIMDIRLPDMSGIDCTTKLKTVLPQLPIIMLTGYPDGRVFFRSLIAGAKGFLVKPVSTEEIVNAVGEVLQGGIALSKQVVPFLVELIQQLRNVTKESQLTKREEEILACVFEGMQDKEIAATLRIGTATVHTHMHRLFEKLGVHSRQSIIGKYLVLEGNQPASGRDRQGQSYKG